VTRPITLPNGLGVPDDVAYVLSYWLTAGLAEARRNAEYLSADVVETVQKLDILGAAWRNGARPAVLDVAYTEPIQWITSRQAASRLSVTPRRVLALIAAGRLDAEQLPSRIWRVSASSVEARKENMEQMKDRSAA
jgi:hypothetical protein